MNGKKVAVLVLGVVAILAVCFGVFKFMTRGSGEAIDNPNSGDVSGEQVSGEQLEEKEFVIGEREAIFTEENYPRIDGSTATIPLSEAFKAEFLGIPLAEATVTHNTTHYAYENLISGDADLILVTQPSDEELELARKAGMELEVIPVVNEAFV